MLGNPREKGYGSRNVGIIHPPFDPVNPFHHE